MSRKPRTSSLSQSSTAQRDGEGGGVLSRDGEGERDEEYGGTKVDQSDDYAFESDVEDDEDDDADEPAEGAGRGGRYLGVGSAGGYGRNTSRSRSGGGGSRRASGIEGIDEVDEDDYFDDDDEDDDQDDEDDHVDHDDDAVDGPARKAEDENDPEPIGLYRMAYTFEAMGEHEMDVPEGALVDVKGRGGGEGWCVAHRVRVSKGGREVGEGAIRRAARVLKGKADGGSAVPTADTSTSTSSNPIEQHVESTSMPQDASVSAIVKNGNEPMDFTDWTYEEPEEGLVPESYLEKVRGRTPVFVRAMKKDAIRREVEAEALAEAEAEAEAEGGAEAGAEATPSQGGQGGDAGRRHSRRSGERRLGSGGSAVALKLGNTDKFDIASTNAASTMGGASAGALQVSGTGDVQRRQQQQRQQQKEGTEERTATVAEAGISEEPEDLSDLDDSDEPRSR